MSSTSISRRVFITFGSLSAAICVIFACITWLFAAITEDDVVKQVMHEEAKYIQQYFDKNGHIIEPRLDYIKLYTRESEFPLAIKRGYEQNKFEKEFSVNGRNIHIERYLLGDNSDLWLTIDGTDIQVITHVSSVMFWFVLGVTTLVMLGSTAIAYALSQRIAKPIKQLTENVLAHEVGAKFNATLSQSRNDEIGKLNFAFSAAFERISLLLAREKNFTRDVSHELRTPITLLKNSLALRADSLFTENDKVLLTQVSEDLEKTVEVLLALARDENLILKEIRVLPILERSVLTLYKANLNVTFDAKLSLDEQFKVIGNPYLVLLMCQNLVNNAYYHSGDGSLSIYNKGSTLIFENNIGEHERPDYQGLGHGQYLVERIANAMHWTLNLEKKGTRYIAEIHTAKT
ncbi:MULTISPECIES: sensor histidine kinase [unclassified Alteromonas]|uniref:sensor histidine kinase n=1 Tax=unclassified Alteromonas TaxID=2614992 RepID=UPI000509F841|nr:MULTISPECIES: HAMP domain-containing sensor histidine kinase [unclassified Alteromonas]